MIVKELKYKQEMMKNSKKNNASIYVVEEKFEDAKNVIRSRNSKMERKYNGQKKKGKMKNNT
jgi:hypothetical protein